MISIKKHLAISTLVVLLTGCGIGGMAGPFPGGYEVVESSNKPKVKPAAPQVVYRIDENRYFEIVPYDQSRCSGPLYYNDKKQDIHSKVIAGGYNVPDKFIIDAANTDYLVGPILPASGNCAADTANRPSCSKRLPYSTDGGRSWKYVSTVYGDAILVSQSTAYVGPEHTISSIDLSKDMPSPSDWKYGYQQKIVIPKPRKAPIDNQFHCNRNAEN